MRPAPMPRFAPSSWSSRSARCRPYGAPPPEPPAHGIRSGSGAATTSRHAWLLPRRAVAHRTIGRVGAEGESAPRSSAARPSTSKHSSPTPHPLQVPPEGIEPISPTRSEPAVGLRGPFARPRCLGSGIGNGTAGGAPIRRSTPRSSCSPPARDPQPMDGGTTYLLRHRRSRVGTGPGTSGGRRRRCGDPG
jgi:hypothetical protein